MQRFWGAAILARWSRNFTQRRKGAKNGGAFFAPLRLCVRLVPVLLLCVSINAQSTLEKLSRTYLEDRNAAAERALREFAAAHADEETGPEAYFVLGYTAFQEKDYSTAAEFLRLAARVHTPLSDYAEFYLAAARQNSGDHPGAIPVLTGFDSRNPDSFLNSRAALALATGLLVTDKPKQAAELLSARRDTLPHPAVDLLLANAWEAAGNTAKSLAAYSEIYYQHAASAEAVEAAKHKDQFAKPTADRLAGRADTLLDAGPRASTRAERMRLLEAAQSAYKELAAVAKGAARERSQVRLGRVLYQLGQTATARTALAALKPADPEADAERLYYLGESNRRLKREDDFLAQVQALGRRHPKSSWYEEALFSASNYTLVTHNASEAAKLYGRLAELFPQGKYAAQSGDRKSVV